MLIIAGKFKGQTVTPHQFGLSWITAKELGGNTISPQQVQLDPGELAFFDSRNPGHPQHKNDARFWANWTLDETTGRFTYTGVSNGRRTRRGRRR